MPSRRATSRIVARSEAFTSRPSIVSVTSRRFVSFLPPVPSRAMAPRASLRHLVREVLQERANRIGDRAAVRAERAELERLRAARQERDVGVDLGLRARVFRRFAISSPRRPPIRHGKHFPHALGVAELEEVDRDVAHVDAIVPRDDAAVSEERADGVELLEAERHVEHRAREDAAERAADLDRLDRSPRLHAAADLVQDLPEGVPSGTSYMPGRRSAR